MRTDQMKIALYEQDKNTL